jgi:L-rhamnose mutarotase
MQRLYFAVDLRDDPALIAAYERWHRAEHIWPEVTRGLRARGVVELELFRCGNRLLQVLQHDPEAREPSPVVTPGLLDSRLAQWETLMWQFQAPLPFAQPGEKWVPMQRIFSLRETLRARAEP